MKLAKKITDRCQYTPTLNGMGYMSPSLDSIQRAFVDHCKQNREGQFLDIGCGFGVATIPAIDEGCHVIACDLYRLHLEILREAVPVYKRTRLTLKAGHFPNDVRFPENSFDGINMSMVLHFLMPESIELAFKEIFRCLKKGGRLYLTTSSPYQGTLVNFIPVYEEKLNRQEWPGDIPDIVQYVPHRAIDLPARNIVFCDEELKRLAFKFGFKVKIAKSFTREEIPYDIHLDGREYSGIICEKPDNEGFQAVNI